MTWPSGPLGRALAVTYLIGFAAAYTGVVWILVLQLRGDDESFGGVPLIVFVVGVLTITALSFALRDRLPERTNRLTRTWAGDQRAYHRLALGLELAGAWRVIRG